MDTIINIALGIELGAIFFVLGYLLHISTTYQIEPIERAKVKASANEYDKFFTTTRARIDRQEPTLIGRNELSWARTVAPLGD